MKKKDKTRYWFDEEATSTIMSALEYRHTRVCSVARNSSYSFFVQYIPDACNVPSYVSCDICAHKTSRGGCYEKEVVINDKGNILFDDVEYAEKDFDKLIEHILNN